MKQTVEQLNREVEALRLALLMKDREIQYLEQQVAYFKAIKYASKSESIHPGQGSLFNEAEAESTESMDEVEFEGSPDTENESDKKRPRPKRKPLPASLKRVEEVIDLPDEKNTVFTQVPLSDVLEKKFPNVSILFLPSFKSSVRSESNMPAPVAMTIANSMWRLRCHNQFPKAMPLLVYSLMLLAASILTIVHFIVRKNFFSEWVATFLVRPSQIG